MNKINPLAQRLRETGGQRAPDFASGSAWEKKIIPLAERLGDQSRQDMVSSLWVLRQRLPFFFHGLSLLTGQRSQRENLTCWSRWEEAGFSDVRKRDRHKKKSFHFALALAGIYLAEDEDLEPITYLLLEPMYRLEEYFNTQKGVL